MGEGNAEAKLWWPAKGDGGAARSCVHKLLRWLNYMILTASCMSVMCMLALRLVPSALGWAFLSFSFVTVISAIMGCLCAAGEAARAGVSAAAAACYGLHLASLIISTSIQGTLFLVLLTRPGAVLAGLRSSRSEYDGRVLLKLDAALLGWVFCIQMVVLALVCMLYQCQPVALYEDLECCLVKRRGRRSSRIQQEEDQAVPKAAEGEEKDNASFPKAEGDSKEAQEPQEEAKQEEKEEGKRADIEEK